MSGARFEDRDHGAKALVRRMAAAKDLVLRVGILRAEEPRRDGVLTIGEVAAFHEFGTRTIPARSFIRGWYDAMIDQNRATLKKLQVRVAEGKLDQRRVFDQLGALFVGQIQKRISDGIPPPLAASTVRQKGSSTPLVDTGQLRSSITFEVTEA